MKIIEINGTNYASTGNIAINIAKAARDKGHTVLTCCKKSRKSLEFDIENQIYIGSRIERVICETICEITGYKDSLNIIGTWKFINKLRRIKPDLIHLHIVHDTYINISMLFKYLKKKNIPIVWTFHDCYALTGQCVYFDQAQCNKWQTGCNNCPQLRRYPNSLFFDRTSGLWNKKKELFTGINNLTIVTPSDWMANLVKKSYLKDYPVKVINNGINLNAFKPIDSRFREKHNLQDKKIVLGVCYIWNSRKGLSDFIWLSKMLSDDYKVVLVGTNDNIDTCLPDNVLSIHRTYDQKELAEIYTTADVLINPTYEDNFPTVNIESLACGTPVITYKTGGSPESLNEDCGSVIEKGNQNKLLKEIKRVCETKPYTKQACIEQASKYDMYEKFDEYVDLFEKLV
ncbi:MAG: glycosyltransferase [Erysipelotrichaceae bacterium]|nr:glycosyltransferase [Erysipelotrichaceae bacterium]